MVHKQNSPLNIRLTLNAQNCNSILYPAEWAVLQQLNMHHSLTDVSLNCMEWLNSILWIALKHRFLAFTYSSNILTSSYMCIYCNYREKCKQHIMVKWASWIGAALWLLDLDHSLLCRGKLFSRYQVSNRIISGWLTASWSWETSGWCSRTITLTLLQNGFGETTFAFWSSPVKAQPNSDAVKRKLLTPKFLNGRSSVRRNGPKIPPGHCADLIHSQRKGFLEVVAAKGGSTNH